MIAGTYLWETRNNLDRYEHIFFTMSMDSTFRINKELSAASSTPTHIESNSYVLLHKPGKTTMGINFYHASAQWIQIFQTVSIKAPKPPVNCKVAPTPMEAAKGRVTLMLTERHWNQSIKCDCPRPSRVSDVHGGWQSGWTSRLSPTTTCCCDCVSDTPRGLVCISQTPDNNYRPTTPASPCNLSAMSLL